LEYERTTGFKPTDETAPVPWEQWTLNRESEPEPEPEPELEGPSEIYLYEMDDDQSDSIDQGQLKALVEAGDLSDQSHIWCTDLDDWTPLGECKFLFPALDGVDSTYLNHKSLFYSTGDDDADNVEVTIAAFRALLASGEQGVTSSTKVWAEGMDKWVEYSSVEHMFSAGGGGAGGEGGGEGEGEALEAAADTAAEAAVSAVEPEPESAPETKQVAKATLAFQATVAKVCTPKGCQIFI
jgi:hypothetical protein